MFYVWITCIFCCIHLNILTYTNTLLLYEFQVKPEDNKETSDVVEPPGGDTQAATETSVGEKDVTPEWCGKETMYTDCSAMCLCQVNLTIPHQ